LYLKKICRRCGRNRKIGKFAIDSSRRDTKRIYCRDCISIINKRYRLSPLGRLIHKRSVDNWKKKNKAAIRQYNKAYYLKKRHIILYNKRAKKETEPMLFVKDFDDSPVYSNKPSNRIVIDINPKPKEI
jgi:hypothetical protein